MWVFANRYVDAPRVLGGMLLMRLHLVHGACETAGDRRGQPEGIVSELFYDLVFVFAITQVSHLLLTHLTWTGVLQSLIVLLRCTGRGTTRPGPPTSWTRRLYHPPCSSNLMLVSLLMSVAIPQASRGPRVTFRRILRRHPDREALPTFAAADSGTIERERGRTHPHLVRGGWRAIWIAGALVDGVLVAIGSGWRGARARLLGLARTYWVPGRRWLAPETWKT